VKIWRPISRWLPLCILLAGRLGAAEVIPPVPEHYFNDYAGKVSASTAGQLNRQLEDFEKQTSSQIVVAVFPKMQSASAVDDYTYRVARAWRVGQKERNNGAVLFVFVEDRKMFLQVGYGLEGAIPDSIAKRITEDVVKPFFQRNDYDGGLSAGVNAILQAARGEYKGTGTTVNAARARTKGRAPLIIFLALFALMVEMCATLGLFAAFARMFGIDRMNLV
jgi:uncharacterized protein